MQMNASCVRMSAMRLHTLNGKLCAQQEMWSFGYGQMWCGLCGYEAREALSTRDYETGEAHSKGQLMLRHIVCNHDLAALFEVQKSDWSTTMDIVRTQFPGLIRDKW